MSASEILPPVGRSDSNGEVAVGDEVAEEVISDGVF